AEDGGAKLRALAARFHCAHFDSGRVPEHPDGAQGRLGVRMAHVDRGRARVRRELGRGRSRLVHLRAQEPARDSRRVRGASDRHLVRLARRESAVQDDRASHRAALGDGDMTTTMSALKKPGGAVTATAKAAIAACAAVMLTQPAQAQLAAPNAAGVSMGHVHYVVEDAAASRDFGVSPGGMAAPYARGESVRCPGLVVLLTQGEAEGGSDGSVVNHVALRVASLEPLAEKG